jgi:hypothetical protein
MSTTKPLLSRHPESTYNKTKELYRNAVLSLEKSSTTSKILTKCFIIGMGAPAAFNFFIEPFQHELDKNNQPNLSGRLNWLQATGVIVIPITLATGGYRSIQNYLLGSFKENMLPKIESLQIKVANLLKTSQSINSEEIALLQENQKNLRDLWHALKFQNKGYAVHRSNFSNAYDNLRKEIDMIADNITPREYSSASTGTHQTNMSESNA